MQLQQQGLHFYAADLSKLDNFPALYNELIKQYGHTYALINNAAVGYDGVLATMQNSEISISSITAHTGFNGLRPYTASKATLEGCSKSLTREVGISKLCRAGLYANRND